MTVHYSKWKFLSAIYIVSDSVIHSSSSDHFLSDVETSASQEKIIDIALLKNLWLCIIILLMTRGGGMAVFDTNSHQSYESRSAA